MRNHQRISVKSFVNLHQQRRHRRHIIGTFIALAHLSLLSSVAASLTSPSDPSMCSGPTSSTLHRRGSRDKSALAHSLAATAPRGGSTKFTPPASAAKAKTMEAPSAGNGGNKLRNILFPVYGEEMTKFLLIGSIKFFVILALTLTRDNKDTMVVTECGAEAIAFLKVSV